MTTSIIGYLPSGRIKRYLSAYAFLASMRILMRSLSVVINFHNTEHQPKGVGLCVANHTSTIDVGILATQNVFSLVSYSGLSVSPLGLLLTCFDCQCCHVVKSVSFRLIVFLLIGSASIRKTRKLNS